MKRSSGYSKALRSFIERLITKARRGDLHSRKIILKYIPRKDVVRELVDEIAPKYADRPGGYTRITKIGQRRSDAADMALIELVGFEGVYKKRKEKSEKDRKKRKEKKEKEMKEAEKHAEETQLSEVEKSEKEKKE